MNAVFCVTPELGKMLGNEFRHFKHIHHRLATEHFLQVFVGIDVTLVLWILEILLLDVDPELFDDLGPWHWPFSDYRREFLADIHGFHECRIGFWHTFTIQDFTSICQMEDVPHA